MKQFIKTFIIVAILATIACSKVTKVTEVTEKGEYAKLKSLHVSREDSLKTEFIRHWFSDSTITIERTRGLDPNTANCISTLGLIRLYEKQLSREDVLEAVFFNKQLRLHNFEMFGTRSSELIQYARICASTMPDDQKEIAYSAKLK